MGHGFRRAFLLARVLPPAALAVLVRFLAALAPARTLRVPDIEDGHEAIEQRERRHERQQATAGIPGREGAAEGIEVSGVHAGSLPGCSIEGEVAPGEAQHR